MDDEPGSLDLLATALEQPYLKILRAADPEDALNLVFEYRPGIVLTDLVMAKMSGLELLDRIVAFDPAIEVILITAHYSTESAVEAIRKGASDYLNKPIPIPVLRVRISTKIEDIRRRQRSLRIQDELRGTAQFENIIGNSPAMWELFSRIGRIAPHFRTVLITVPNRGGEGISCAGTPSAQPGIVEQSGCSQLLGHCRNSFRKRTFWPC